MHRPMDYPVILVLDSDDGVGPIAGVIEKLFGVKFSWGSKNDFYHVTDNFYVVKTPENGSKKTCIEDLFPIAIRQKKLNGKIFNPSNNIDITKEYGKEIFAKHVVKVDKSIDYSGFDPLLDRLCKVIADHASKR